MGDFGFDIISNRTSSAKGERGTAHLISFKIEAGFWSFPSSLGILSFDDRIIGLPRGLWIVRFLGAAHRR